LHHIVNRNSIDIAFYELTFQFLYFIIENAIMSASEGEGEQICNKLLLPQSNFFAILLVLFRFHEQHEIQIAVSCQHRHHASNDGRKFLFIGKFYGKNLSTY
jgi:hypothetical protein